jgi:micrococcal nuclease
MRQIVTWTAVFLSLTLLSLAGCTQKAPAPIPTATAVPPPPASATLPPPSPTAPPAPSPAPPTATPPPTNTALPTATATVVKGIRDTDRQLTLAQLVRVIDGNTIEVKINGQNHVVRYIGIDPLGDGTAAAARNKQLVTGQTLKLEKDTADTDAQGNLLRYVFAKTYMLNAELARLGYAQAVSAPPNTRYDELLKSVEAEARAKNRGLWVPPPKPTATPRPTKTTIPTRTPTPKR